VAQTLLEVDQFPGKSRFPVADQEGAAGLALINAAGICKFLLRAGPAKLLE
jgi:hypothetical protein